MADAVSPELEALKEFNDELVEALKEQVKLITWELYKADVISYSVKRKVMEQSNVNVEREVWSKSCAVELMKGVETAIRESPEKTEGFFKVLEKYLDTCGMVLSDLRRYLVKKVGKEKPFLKSISFGKSFTSNAQVPLYAMRRGSTSVVLSYSGVPNISKYSRYVFPQPQMACREKSCENNQTCHGKRRDSALTLPQYGKVVAQNTTPGKTQQKIPPNRRASWNFTMQTNMAGDTIPSGGCSPFPKSLQQKVGLSPQTNQEPLPRENERFSGVLFRNDTSSGVDQQEDNPTYHPPMETPAQLYQPAASADHPTEEKEITINNQMQSFNCLISASDSVSTISSSSSKATSMYKAPQLMTPVQQSKHTPPQERHSPRND